MKESDLNKTAFNRVVAARRHVRRALEALEKFPVVLEVEDLGMAHDWLTLAQTRIEASMRARTEIHAMKKKIEEVAEYFNPPEDLKEAGGS